jgi:hypothetical protein
MGRVQDVERRLVRREPWVSAVDRDVPGQAKQSAGGAAEANQQGGIEPFHLGRILPAIRTLGAIVR